MGIFSGEKHTRDTYEKAEKEARIAEDHARYPDDVRVTPDSAVIYLQLDNKAERAKARVEKLYGKGKKEAIALEEEHDRLLEKVREAIRALSEFEKDKLGMKESIEDIVKEEDK